MVGMWACNQRYLTTFHPPIFLYIPPIVYLENLAIAHRHKKSFRMQVAKGKRLVTSDPSLSNVLVLLW